MVLQASMESLRGPVLVSSWVRYALFLPTHPATNEDLRRARFECSYGFVCAVPY